MKAMVLNETEKVEDNPLKYTDVEIREPAGYEVLLDNISCGVCHSNLHMIEGDWISHGLPRKKPIIPGHEIIGRVHSLGDLVEDVKKGDVVGVQPLFQTCGKCEYCTTGKEYLCPYGKWTGETVDGGYAQQMIADSRYVNRVPSNIDYVKSSPLFCPGITAYCATEKAELAPGKTVYVVGIGGVGHVALQFAKLYGSRVVAVSTSKSHEDLAYKMGADDVLLMDRDFSNAEKYRKTADSLILFAPYEKAIMNSMKMVKDGGVMVQGVFGKVDYDFTTEIKLKGTKIGGRHDMDQVLNIASQNRIKIESKEYRLEDTNIALQDLKHGNINGRAVLKMN